ncbi:MAG: GGDEF domain-containing protein [Lachnospiraceae bacterium]|nr:GGDEF domain-containing protein [Lachnospiraceae bacterium]
MDNISMLSIFTANFLGIMLALTLYVANSWRWKREDLENLLLIFMLILVGITCITEPAAFLISGKEGGIYTILIYLCDTWTYAANLLASASWFVFIAYHLDNRIPRIPVNIINALVAVGLLLLFVNLFTPVVFRIDEHNNYQRLSVYYYYFIAEFIMLFGSLAFYIYIRIKGRRIRFFFFWVYVLPILTGVIIQTANYGLSLIAPCMLIALTGLMSTIQNELIFKDKLTGLYNRYYLDQLGEELRNDKDADYTFLMLDINDFKSINDRFGHLEGDRAIVDTADIIKKAIGSSGAGIRYAGDEFVIVLSTRTPIDTDIFVTNIRKGFDEFNAEEGHKYELHVSIGQSMVNLSEVSIDEVMNRIDKLMYEDKRRSYKKTDSVNV